MPTGKETISDYDENKGEIEHWFSIRCEQKYIRFAELLRENGEETTWVNVRDLYRYDKRLIFDCFRYISFLEEFFRATIVRNSEDRDRRYEELQESYLKDLTGSIIELNQQGAFCYDRLCLKDDLLFVKKMRNCIAHNKILLETDYKSEITALRNLLPPDYKNKSEDETRRAANGLSVSDSWTVIF